jgi:hypothetical protein
MQVFRDLILAYPTSAQLEAFVESEEGGRLRIIDRKEGQCLIRYEKGLSDFSKPHVPWFRSVIWDTVANRPLSIAPPQKLRHYATENGQESDWEVHWRVQPLLDGVMVNVYRTAEGWDMATRSRLGASGYFYSSKPFSQLFLEALNGVSSLEEWGQGLVKPEVGAIFYSFLLQHCENRNVTPIHHNVVYLIHRGTVGADGCVEWDDFSADLPQGVHRVESAEPPMALSWTDQGQVWRDGKGGRVIDRRAAWKRVKDMRGNDASNIARFLRLYHQGLLAEYVGYYPEEEPFMRHHVQWMHRITRELFATYRAMYVRRCVTKEGVDRMWWPHVHQLQMMYQKSRRALTIIDAADYLRHSSWHRVAHLIRKAQAEGDLDEEASS